MGQSVGAGAGGGSRRGSRVWMGLPPELDLTKPAGEPALVGPDSVTWRVFKNPVSVFIGGISAVILELAEPRVRSGIWDHTRFRTDPIDRLERTGIAAMITVYGARSLAERRISDVNRMHRRVTGTTPDGVEYRALDPELLDWVHVTAAFGFIEAYSRFVEPLPVGERDRAWAEMQTGGRLYGATRPPASVAEQQAAFAAMRPHLEPSPIVFEFLEIARRMPLLPAPLRFVQRVLVSAAVELTPAPVRERLGLGPELGLSRVAERSIRTLGRIADRLVLRANPAVQACERLGLPRDHLYRRDSRAGLDRSEEQVA